MNDSNSNIHSFSHHLRDIQIKFQKFDLETKGQCQGGEKWDLGYSTINIRFHIGYIFQNLATCREHTTQKATHAFTLTHTHTHTHPQTLRHKARDSSDDYRQN